MTGQDKKVLRQMREFASDLSDVFGPMFGRDVVRLIDEHERALRVIEAAEAYLDDAGAEHVLRAALRDFREAK